MAEFRGGEGAHTRRQTGVHEDRALGAAGLRSQLARGGRGEGRDVDERAAVLEDEAFGDQVTLRNRVDEQLAALSGAPD